MTGNDNSLDPYDFDSLNSQPATQAGTKDTNSWYYRPSSGMNDWVAQMSKASQGDNTNAANGADSQSLNDSYNAQKQAADQFGQNQPFTLATTSVSGDMPDFMVKQPLQLQQNYDSKRGFGFPAPEEPLRAEDDDKSLFYPQPSPGLTDWTAQLGKLPQGGNANGMVDSAVDMQALHDSYQAQLQASGRFAQDQPLGLGAVADAKNIPDFMTSLYDAQNRADTQFARNHPFTLGNTLDTKKNRDFTTAQPLQLQKTPDDENSTVSYGEQQGRTPFAPRAFTLDTTRNTANPQSPTPLSVSEPSPKPSNLDYYSTLEMNGSLNPIGDIGVPDIPRGTKGYSYGGSVGTDWDGSIKAYGVRGTPTAYTGSDILDNASKNERYNATQSPEKSLLPNIIARDSKGRLIINSSGYYQSLTSGKDTQEGGNMYNIDGEHVPYVALSSQQIKESGAKNGDYVWIHNTDTNQGAWAIVAESRGSIVPGSKKAAKKDDVELSPAAQDRIGITRKAANPGKGTTEGSPFVEITVFPNTGKARFYTPSK